MGTFIRGGFLKMETDGGAMEMPVCGERMTGGN